MPGTLPVHAFYGNDSRRVAMRRKMMSPTMRTMTTTMMALTRRPLLPLLAHGLFAPIANCHGKASHKHKADDKVTSCLHLLDRLIKKAASPSSFSAGPAHPMIQQSHYPLSLPHPSIVCTRSWYVSIIMATKIDCCWLLLAFGSVHAYSPVGSSHHYEGVAGRSGWERLAHQFRSPDKLSADHRWGCFHFHFFRLVTPLTLVDRVGLRSAGWDKCAAVWGGEPPKSWSADKKWAN